MAITPVRFTVKTKFQKEGHDVGPADYSGNEITRPDINSPGGQRTSYILHAVVPVQQDGSVVTTGANLDVTDLVMNGQIEVN